jgi:hypothetical protein
LRLAGEEDAFVAEAGAAFDLGDRGLHVPERERRDRDQAARIGAAPIGQEVVVGAHAGEHQLGILKSEEDLAPEPADVGVDRHGPDRERVHVAQPGVGIVGGEGDLGEAVRRGREGLSPAGGRGMADGRDRRAIADDPDLAAGSRVARDVGSQRGVLRGESLREEVRRLGDVAVGIDDPVDDRIAHRKLLLAGARGAGMASTIVRFVRRACSPVRGNRS